MDRTLPALRTLDWRWLRLTPRRFIVAALLALNIGLAVYELVGIRPFAYDWSVYVRAGEAITSDGQLYGRGIPWVYSPVMAYLFALIAPIGIVGWRLLHVVAAAMLPWRHVAILALISWPLATDLHSGNVAIFTFAAAAWALHGSRIGTFVFLVMAVLVPRPLMLPILVWLLWQRPETRIPFLVIAVAHGVAVLATGWGWEWVDRYLDYRHLAGTSVNFAPTRLIGLWWMLIGVPLAIWATWRGRLGIAALAISPVLIPQHLIFGLLELSPRNELRAYSAPSWMRRGRS